MQKGKFEDVRMSFTELISVASLSMLGGTAIESDDVQSNRVVGFVLLQLHEVQMVTVFVGDRQSVGAVAHFELCGLVSAQFHVIEVDVVEPRDSASFLVISKASRSSFTQLTQLFCARSAVFRRLQRDCTRCSA